MIIPIGHEQSEVRRLPWVTMAVAALCLLAFLATDIPHATDSWLDDEAIEEATDYWLEHAYLEPREEILGEATYLIPHDQVEVFVANLREDNPGPSDREKVAAQQAELERLSKHALQLNFSGKVENDFTRWGHTPTQPKLRTLVTYMFMHGGWLHLLSNLFLLLLAAPAIEDRWGRPLFSGFYLLAGLFAGVFYTVLAPDSSIPLVGASGAIAGVLGAFLVRHWSTNIRFAYFFFVGLRWVRGTFEAPAWAMLPLWFANELLQAWLFHSAGVSSGVAYWAHVGGFLFGVCAALLVAKLGIEERYIHPAIESKVTLMEGHPAIEQAMQAREAGDLDGAFATLRSACDETPGDADLVLAFWDAAVATRQPQAASAAMLCTIRSATGRGELEIAARYWNELSDVLPTALADPNSLVRMLPVLKEQDASKKVVLALRQAVDPANQGMSVGLAFRIIEQARELDPPSALQAARSALGSADLHETKRQRLEELIANLESEGVEPPVIEAPVEAAPAADGRSQAPQWDDDEPLLLEGEDGPAPRMSPNLAAVAVASVAAAAPRALSAEGSLIDDEASDRLALDPEEELGFDPSAQLDAIPVAHFGLEPDGELGLPAEADFVDDDPPGALHESQFGSADDEGLGLDPSDLMSMPDTLPIGLTKPTPAATPPALPSMTPPPLPGTHPPELPELTPLGDDSVPEGIPIGDSIGDDELRALIEIPRFSAVKAVDGVPREFTPSGLVIAVNGERKARIEYEKVQAIAVAAVSGLAPSPVVVIDLVLNWNEEDGALLRVLRLRSDRFDPRKLVPAESRMLAFRAFLAELRERTGATPLPDADWVIARPLCKMADLASYEREVLQVAG